MALEPEHELLARAVDVARRSETDWIEVSTAVMGRVRSIVRPADPVHVYDDRGELDQDGDGSRTYVSTRVLTDALRRLLQASPTHAPEAIELDLDAQRLRAIRIGLVAAYGVRLPALADRVRSQVVAELGALIGPDPDFSAADVDIEFTDVVDGDPTRV